MIQSRIRFTGDPSSILVLSDGATMQMAVQANESGTVDSVLFQMRASAWAVNWSVRLNSGSVNGGMAGQAASSKRGSLASSGVETVRSRHAKTSAGPDFFIAGLGGIVPLAMQSRRS